MGDDEVFRPASNANTAGHINWSGATMNELLIGLPRVAGLGFRDDDAPTLEGREPSNDELVATMKQAAEQGWLASRDIVRLVAKRIEEAELAILGVSRKLP